MNSKKGIDALIERVEELESTVEHLNESIFRINTDPTIRRIIRGNESDRDYIKSLEARVKELEDENKRLIDQSLEDARELHRNLVVPIVMGEMKVEKGENWSG